MLNIKMLKAGYGRQEILQDVSLSCRRGEITTLIGPNGCGKSTLMKAIVGLAEVKDGEISVDGMPLRGLSDNERAKKIAYLSQGKNLPDITVGGMVLHGRFPHLSYPRKYRSVDRTAARQAMEKMDILDLAERPMSQLSGGMRQKVYIAMALCQGADIIMLDEPTTYLDISHQLKINDLCRELANEGKTVFVVSHDIVSALKNSDAIAVMQDGKILKAGTPNEILQSRIIPQVFGVEVLPVLADGKTEYYFNKAVQRV